MPSAEGKWVVDGWGGGGVLLFYLALRHPHRERADKLVAPLVDDRKVRHLHKRALSIMGRPRHALPREVGAGCQ